MLAMTFRWILKTINLETVVGIFVLHLIKCEYGVHIQSTKVVLVIENKQGLLNQKLWHRKQGLDRTLLSQQKFPY